MPTNAKLIDGFGRAITYFRISVTDRCNLRCTYCMPGGGVEKLGHDEILSLEEIAKAARAAVGLGITKIRLTGGEPLLRKNIASLMAALAALRPKPDLRITTNGLLLEKSLPLFARHGFSTINVSLDSLDPGRYGAITGLSPERAHRAHAAVLGGIRAALKHGGFQVKLNCVALGGINQDEMEAFAKLTRESALAVRFIEYMPVGRHTPFRQDRFYPAKNIINRLKRLGPLEELPTIPGEGPARRFKLAGARGELGVISAVSSHFCDACNRLRLTAAGGLAPCLFSSRVMDLKGPLRAGADDQALAAILARAVALKPKGHQQTPLAMASAGCPMSRLGG